MSRTFAKITDQFHFMYPCAMIPCTFLFSMFFGMLWSIDQLFHPVSMRTEQFSMNCDLSALALIQIENIEHVWC